MILLDTVAIILIATGERMRGEARALVLGAAPGTVAVSVVSYWELGVLGARRGKTGRDLGPARDWLTALVGDLGATVLSVSPEVALAAATSDYGLRDPADRLFVATARNIDATLVTRDRAILALAQAGHVRAVAC